MFSATIWKVCLDSHLNSPPLDHSVARFSDIFGRKSALCLAMSLFMVGNLIAGFSKTIIQLIVFRGYISCFMAKRRFFLNYSQVLPVLVEVD
jgi:MFS family permease